MSRWNRVLLCGSLCLVLGAGLACKKDEEAEDYSEETTTDMATEDTSAMGTDMTTGTDTGMGTDMSTDTGTESPPP